MNWYPHVPYNDNYPKLFEAEMNRILSVLHYVDVQHFGSTAVPGLGGKGYIDIYVIAPKDKLNETSKAIQNKLNYEYKERASILGERLFHKRVVLDEKENQNIYHLHLTYPENTDYIQSVKFRDYLRNNPLKALEYERIKKVASLKANKQKTRESAKRVYMDTKLNIIEDILNDIQKIM